VKRFAISVLLVFTILLLAIISVAHFQYRIPVCGILAIAASVRAPIEKAHGSAAVASACHVGRVRRRNRHRGCPWLLAVQALGRGVGHHL